VLVHRLPGQDGHPFDIALQDGLAALDHLATLAPLPLLHVGLSSGGHLAGVMACQRESAGAVIAYAPLNANHRGHKAPPGKPDFPPPEKQAFYDAWPVGIATEPHGLPKCPVFLAYALHDSIVPIDHALNLIKAAQVHGLDVEAHVFPQAEHGFALRGLDGTQDQWPALAARWMATQLGR
jgi:dienelactone hydrolase